MDAEAIIARQVVLRKDTQQRRTRRGCILLRLDTEEMKRLENAAEESFQALELEAVQGEKRKKRKKRGKKRG